MSSRKRAAMRATAASTRKQWNRINGGTFGGLAAESPLVAVGSGRDGDGRSTRAATTATHRLAMASPEFVHGKFFFFFKTWQRLTKHGKRTDESVKRMVCNLYVDGARVDAFCRAHTGRPGDRCGTWRSACRWRP